MNTKDAPKAFDDEDFPYDPNNEKEVMEFWKNSISHTGIDELREKIEEQTKDPSI